MAQRLINSDTVDQHAMDFQNTANDGEMGQKQLLQLKEIYQRRIRIALDQINHIGEYGHPRVGNHVIDLVDLIERIIALKRVK